MTIIYRHHQASWWVLGEYERLFMSELGTPIAGLGRHLYWGWAVYRGTSLRRNRHPIGPYSRTMLRDLW